jgi:hypothetical protein
MSLDIVFFFFFFSFLFYLTDAANREFVSRVPGENGELGFSPSTSYGGGYPVSTAVGGSSLSLDTDPG